MVEDGKKMKLMVSAGVVSKHSAFRAIISGMNELRMMMTTTDDDDDVVVI
jgi:hypothetical protein